MESFDKIPEPLKPDTFSDVFAVLNEDLEYEFSLLSTHAPEEGTYAFQLMDPNQQNNMALSLENTEKYAELLRKSLTDTNEDFMVTINTFPSVHIVVQKAD